jgi:hypothetical protein
MVMNLRVPYIAGKLLSSCTVGGFPRRALKNKRNSISAIKQLLCGKQKKYIHIFK